MRLKEAPNKQSVDEGRVLIRILVKVLLGVPRVCTQSHFKRVASIFRFDQLAQGLGKQPRRPSSIIKRNFPNGYVSQRKKIVYSPILMKFGMKVGHLTKFPGELCLVFIVGQSWLSANLGFESVRVCVSVCLSVVCLDRNRTL